MIARLLLICALCILCAAPASAGFEEGERAYRQKEWVKAIAELRPAAESGDDRAMLLLGNMYNDGNGVLKSPAEAMKLYRRAAEKHNAEAMIAIAAMYQQGIGVTKDAAKARAWFARSARLGNQGGAFFYAVSLSKAEGGLGADLRNAYKWFRIAEKMDTYSNIAQAAGEMAGIVEAELLRIDIHAAREEARVWTPEKPESLGPLPGE